MTQFLRFSAQEGLLLNVGTVFDLLDLERGRRGLKEDTDGG